MKLKYQVTGMTCAACSARVEKVTSAVPGVNKAEVNLLKGTMTVEAESDCTKQIVAAVADAGYGIVLPKKEQSDPFPQNPLKEMKVRIIVSAAFLVVLMYFTMGHMIGLPLYYHFHQVILFCNDLR